MNHNRRRVYEAEDIAVSMRETFTDRPVEHRTRFDFDWPDVLQHVGDSLAIAYASDKWKPKRDDGKRDIELYKHLAESRNRVFCAPGIICPEEQPDSALECIGPFVDFTAVPKPRDFAVLGFFKEANIQLYTRGSSSHPAFGSGQDDGVVTLTVAHGMLGGSKLLWHEDKRGRRDQPFIFVYTAADGVMLLIVGDKLDVLKDGIVG